MPQQSVSQTVKSCFPLFLLPPPTSGLKGYRLDNYICKTKSPYCSVIFYLAFTVSLVMLYMVLNSFHVLYQNCSDVTLRGALHS